MPFCFLKLFENSFIASLFSDSFLKNELDDTFQLKLKIEIWIPGFLFMTSFYRMNADK